ncbi:GH13398 [Drosophila grimshawi]|uniref:GH13398 n=2 Tax=Drosophila grimshawi TaxID=7222 RepID=B4JPH7_DROGR|nr:GH13398 [Drosophila grimshawi]
MSAVAQSVGTPSFGFDSANSCSPNGKVSRRGRAQMLAAIPCDLGKQAYCHLPGSIYPWHAVRRFVHENQGLMKRMYGDVRHISILRDEIQNNEVVDPEDIEEAAQRYSKMPRGAKYMLHGRDSDRDDYSSYKGNDVLMEPHFRPVSVVSSTSTTTTTATPTTPTTTTITTRKTTPTKAATTTTGTPTTTTPSSSSSTGTVVQPEHPSVDSNSVYEVPGTSSTTSTTTQRTVAGENIQIIDSPQLGQGLRNLSIAAAAAAPATLVKTTTAAPKRTTVMPLRRQTSTTTKAAAAAAYVKAAPLQTTTTTTAATLSSTTAASSALPPRRNVTKTTMGTTTPFSFASLFSPTFNAALNAEKQRRPLTVSTTTTTTTSSSSSSSTTAAPATSTTKAGLLREGGQLFQDAMKQEPMAVSSNMRGVNACPVKDEVVAPFWANNTRGEVLALLNLYPFEQYVHWEKCTHEFKQMFCRDGCRCEQQYRLHRLLAYDPHNECRGIFSDWFRFPSSCICKCYNIPMDFRATSRSPRSDSSFDDGTQSMPQPDPIRAAEAEVQRAIYEHATDQWYRPRDDFDFFEG